jgi:hypothetical protein
MKKETRGRKPMKPEDRKSRCASVRIKPLVWLRLVDKYGSIQVFFDNCVKAEKEKDE